MRLTESEVESYNGLYNQIVYHKKKSLTKRFCINLMHEGGGIDLNIAEKVFY